MLSLWSLVSVMADCAPTLSAPKASDYDLQASLRISTESMLDCLKAATAAWLPHCVHTCLPGPNVTLHIRALLKDTRKDTLLWKLLPCMHLADHEQQSTINLSRHHAGAP